MKGWLPILCVFHKLILSRLFMSALTYFLFCLKLALIGFFKLTKTLKNYFSFVHGCKVSLTCWWKKFLHLPLLTEWLRQVWSSPKEVLNFLMQKMGILEGCFPMSYLRQWVQCCGPWPTSFVCFTFLVISRLTRSKAVFSARVRVHTHTHTFMHVHSYIHNTYMQALFIWFLRDQRNGIILTVEIFPTSTYLTLACKLCRKNQAK